MDALGIMVSLDCEVYESSPMWLQSLSLILDFF